MRSGSGFASAAVIVSAIAGIFVALALLGAVASAVLTIRPITSSPAGVQVTMQLAVDPATGRKAWLETSTYADGSPGPVHGYLPTTLVSFLGLTYDDLDSVVAQLGAAAIGGLIGGLLGRAAVGRLSPRRRPEPAVAVPGAGQD